MLLKLHCFQRFYLSMFLAYRSFFFYILCSSLTYVTVFIDIICSRCDACYRFVECFFFRCFSLSSATRVIAACQFINRYFAGYGVCCLCVILVATYQSLIYIHSVCVCVWFFRCLNKNTDTRARRHCQE